MKTQLVYALVSTFEDTYYEQLLISLYSARLHNPTATIVVVCDEGTVKTFETRKGILNYTDNIIPIATPCDWNNLQKSRYLKTNLRKFVEGDYLFIDTDTIITSSLETIDSLTCEIGAVFDSHIDRPICRNSNTDSEKWIFAEARQAGVSIDNMLHYNSGVFYVKDTPLAHQLYDNWYALYKEFRNKGVCVDQLPLLIANNNMGGVIETIAPEWNCQIITPYGTCLLPDAKIIHYFAKKSLYEIAFPWIIDKVKYTDDVTPEIKSIVERPTESFYLRYKIIKGKEVEFIESPMYQVFCECPNYFNLLTILSRKYQSIKMILRRILYAFK